MSKNERPKEKEHKTNLLKWRNWSNRSREL